MNPARVKRLNAEWLELQRRLWDYDLSAEAIARSRQRCEEIMAELRAAGAVPGFHSNTEYRARTSA